MNIQANAFQQSSENQSAAAIEHQKRAQEAQETYIDHRQSSADSSALQAMLDGRVIQRVIDIGWVPRNVGNYRNHSTLVGNGVSSPYGGARFADTNIDNLYDDNYYHVGSSDITFNRALRDDDDNTYMISRAEATDYSPEVDHIVEKADGGANSLDNARILTKQNNSGTGNPGRPGRGAQYLKTFRQLRLREYSSTANQHNDHFTRDIDYHDGNDPVTTRFNRISNTFKNARSNLSGGEVDVLETYRNKNSNAITAKNQIKNDEAARYHRLRTGAFIVDEHDLEYAVRVD